MGSRCGPAVGATWLGQRRALRSGAYDGLRPGYWVTYIGPFEATADGRRQAERVQHQLPGTLVRLIRWPETTAAPVHIIPSG